MLFTPISFRTVTLRNRIMVSPMCQYSSEDGRATDWHLVHLGSRAVGGAALVMAEATAVEARGRISARDLGIWEDAHVPGLQRIARFIAEQGAAPGHPARARRTQGIGLGARGTADRPLSAGRRRVAGRRTQPRAVLARSPGPRSAFTAATSRRGRLIRSRRRTRARGRASTWWSCISPTATSCTSSSRRFPTGAPTATAERFENRTRLAREIARAVRAAWPDALPLLVRISTTDWAEGGWDVGQIGGAGARL